VTVGAKSRVRNRKKAGIVAVANTTPVPFTNMNTVFRTNTNTRDEHGFSTGGHEHEHGGLSDPLDGDEMLDLLELGITGDHGCLLPLGGCDGNGVRIGHREVGFDLRGTEGEILIARAQFERQGLELARHLLGEGVPVLAGDPIVDLAQVDDGEEEWRLLFASLEQQAFHLVSAGLVLHPGEDGERVEQPSFLHVRTPRGGPPGGPGSWMVRP